MVASVVFGRPVGGRRVVDDIVDYLFVSYPTAPVTAYLREGRSQCGPICLDPGSNRAADLQDSYGWALRRSVEISVSPKLSPISRIDLWASRSRVRVNVAGESLRSVTDEKFAILRAIHTPRRIGRFMVIAVPVGVAIPGAIELVETAIRGLH